MGLLTDYYVWTRVRLRGSLHWFIKLYKVSMIILLIVIVVFCYYFLKVFPEVGMVYHSQCINPVTNWDGKLFNMQIWENNLHSRQANFNVHDPSNLYDRRALRQRQLIDGPADVEPHKITFLNRIMLKLASRTPDFKASNPGSTADDRPIILWGSHHKTGTYLAQKIFSRICERMRWCCAFHVTRDSINAVEDSLQREKVHVLGHSQWVWLPTELNIKSQNYRFIHFYRGPVAKILSGYRYHGDGVEGWTKKSELSWRRACPLSADLIANVSGTKISNSEAEAPIRESNNSNRNRNGGNSIGSSSSSGVTRLLKDSRTGARKPNRRRKNNRRRRSTTTPNDSTKQDDPDQHNHHHGANHHERSISRGQVFEYCESSHLCETCCRREHEVEVFKTKHLKHTNVVGHINDSIVSDHHTYLPSYLLRPDREYKTICKYLDKVHSSLQNSLLSEPPEVGIAVEATVDYYESLRMARIYNATKADPKTLNIDLDDMMANYDEVVRAILSHLELDVSDDEFNDILNDLRFFNVETSTVYRWSMSNPLFNHINNNHPKIDYRSLLLQNSEIMKLYEPIFELMGGVK